MRENLGRKGPSIPQMSWGDGLVQNLISDDSLNPPLEKIFGRPFPSVVSQPNPSIPGSFPELVEITSEVE